MSYQLDSRDPIFDSLREDYPSFDRWFDGVRRAHRTAWTIRHGAERYAGLMLVKDEEDAPYGLPGKVLKVSTLKVIDEAQGRRYGELLLKTLFGHAEHHGHDAIYVTVFEKHTSLVELLAAFGFKEHGKSAVGELVLAKRRRPDAQDESLDPLQFHTTIGPPAIDARAPLFVVPVEPRWHDALFPDYPGQMTLLTGESPYGNALRKAYLCNAPTRQVIPGATLLFYRSHERPAVTVAGVVEDVHVSSIPEEVARYVGRRTVYTLDDIARLCRSARPVLTLLFRQDRLLEPAWSRRELLSAGVLKSHPQSITKVKTEEGRLWVQERLNEQR